MNVVIYRDGGLWFIVVDGVTYFAGTRRYDALVGLVTWR